jgi:hypothetical protein
MFRGSLLSKVCHSFIHPWVLVHNVLFHDRSPLSGLAPCAPHFNPRKSKFYVQLTGMSQTKRILYEECKGLGQRHDVVAWRSIKEHRLCIDIPTTEDIAKLTASDVSSQVGFCYALSQNKFLAWYTMRGTHIYTL